MQFLTAILPTIQHMGVFGYWIFLLIAFAESLAFVGTVVPGTLGTAFGGALVARGYFDFGDMIWFVAVGAILGDVMSFYIGKRSAGVFNEKNRFFNKKLLAKGEAFFAAHGSKSIFLGRFIGPIRSIVPLVAGVSGMRKRVFLFWNILSGFLWAIVTLAAGYFAGGAIETVVLWSNKAGIVLLVCVVVLVILWFVVKHSAPVWRFAKSIILSIWKGICTNPEVEKFVQKHPQFFAWVQRRIDKQHFSGLSLTLLVIATVYATSALFGITRQVVFSDTIVTIDTRVANLLFAFRDTELLAVFTWVSFFAKTEVILGISAVVVALLWMWKKRVYIIPYSVTLLGSGIFCIVGKFIFHRERPSVAYYLEESFSYPSGHATLSVAVFGFIAYLLLRRKKTWLYRVNVFFVTLAMIIAVGLSRLYLGEHYLSDVLGGYVLGALWVCIGITIAEWLQRKNSTQAVAQQIEPRIKILTGILLVAGVVGFVGFGLTSHQTLAHKTTQDTIVESNPLNAFTQGKLPKFTETLLGNQQEPFSFAIVAADDQHFIADMRAAGWKLADSTTLLSVSKLAQAALSNAGYQTAPMTPSFWNTQVHDFGFEKPTSSDTVRQRHHARFWRTQIRLPDGSHVYMGTASFDIGIKWFITHKIQPDIDTEREQLATDLQNAGVVGVADKQQFVNPTLGANFSGDQFFTDGKIYVVLLK